MLSSYTYKDNESCLVLLSGGQDSATCLAMATKFFKKVFTISFDYGQRHSSELLCADRLAGIAKVRGHFLVPINSLQYITKSPLIHGSPLINGELDGTHPQNRSLPATFVPGRNYIFLGMAAIKAYQLGVQDIFIGTSQIDYSGYPDCRRSSLLAIEMALFLCLAFEIRVQTPLLHLTKAETVLLMQKLDRLDWYTETHTCYRDKWPPCHKCQACILRTKGFKEAGVIDPLIGGV